MAGPLRSTVLSLVFMVLVGCANRPEAQAADEPIPAPASQGVARELGRGLASWYGERHHGRRTASGEAFDMHALTAAHPSLPFGSLVRVLNPASGQSVVVRINDRGPFAPGRLIDLSRAAAVQIGLVRAGVAPVVLLVP